jgi:hypothetical protein
MVMSRVQMRPDDSEAPRAAKRRTHENSRGPRMAKDAQTALEPAPSSLMPHSRLTMSTISSPRPPASRVWVARRVGSAREPSRTVSSTVSSKPAKVVVNAVCACTRELVARLAHHQSNRIDEIRQSMLDEVTGDEPAGLGSTDQRGFEGGLVRPERRVARHVRLPHSDQMDTTWTWRGLGGAQAKITLRRR